MKNIIAISCILSIGCSTPTMENKCCTDDRCSGYSWKEKAECLEKWNGMLEKELEITKLKMQYECKEAK